MTTERQTTDPRQTRRWSIDEIRSIVDNRQASVVDDVLVDVQTANAVVLVFDALSPSNQTAAGWMPLARFAQFAWKNVSNGRVSEI